jgi:hypothetical protein
MGWGRTQAWTTHSVSTEACLFIGSVALCCSLNVISRYYTSKGHAEACKPAGTDVADLVGSPMNGKVTNNNNYNNKHGYAGQLNSFTRLRALLLPLDRGFED